MTISYSAGTGTVINSFAMTQTLATQAQQSGNRTVVVTNTLSALGANIGTKYSTYVGRLVVISRGTGNEQRRLCISQAAGTGTTVILTVNEDWTTNPVATTDTIHVAYDVDDIETGGAGGGINLNAKTGLYELTNDLNLNSGAGLYNGAGQALELDDNGSSINTFVASGAFFYSGYSADGKPVGGGLFTSYNNSNGEPNIQFQSSSKGYFYDTLFWAQLVTQQFECANGSSNYFNGCKFLFNTQELHLYGATLIDCAITGKKATTEIIRVDAGTVVNGLVLSNVDTLDTAADTATETITLEGVIFSNITDLINVRNNKTWNLIDPVWSATSYTDFTWIGTTANYIYDKRSVKVTVQQADGTELSNTLVVVYAGGIVNNLVLELVTDGNGYAEDAFTYRQFLTGSTAITYSEHAVRIDKWLYTPFVAAQASNESFNTTVTLLTDPNIVETTQSTALSDGSGITWNYDGPVNTSVILRYTGGTGTLLVGMIITGGTSGATGTVTEIIEGDSTAGTVHLSDAFSTFSVGGETISRTGGTAGTWSATYTAATMQKFSRWIDGNNKSLQVIYDYLAALTSETTLSATGKLIHEWGIESETRVLYLGIDGFYTNRNTVGVGIIIVNTGAGIVEYFTDDNGGTFTPYVGIQLTISANVTLVGAEVRIYDYEGGPPDFGTELDGAESHGSSTFVFESTASNLIYIQILKSGYEEFGQQYTMPSSSGDFYANLKVDTNM